MQVCSKWKMHDLDGAVWRVSNVVLIFQNISWMHTSDTTFRDFWMITHRAVEVLRVSWIWVKTSRILNSGIMLVVMFQKNCTVEPMYYGHLGTNKKCPNYQGVLIFQVNLHIKAPFGDHNWVCGLCRCPYFQESWLTGFTVPFCWTETNLCLLWSRSALHLWRPLPTVWDCEACSSHELVKK